MANFIQMATYAASPSYAQVRYSVADMLTILTRERGYRVLEIKKNRYNPNLNEYVLWHPVSYNTVELYDETEAWVAQR